MINFELLKSIKEKGITQKKLAVKLKLNEGYVSRVINGRYNPTEQEKKNIARALKKSVEELFPTQPGA